MFISVIRPPWLQPMMPTRLGSRNGYVSSIHWPAEIDVVDLAAAVVDLLVESAAVAGAAAVIGGDDRVALLQQFAEDVRVAGVGIGVDALVREDDQRLLIACGRDSWG